MSKVVSFIVPEWSINFLVYHSEENIEENKLSFLKAFVERNKLENAVWEWEDAEVKSGNWNDVTGLTRDDVMVVNALVA